MLRDWIIKWLLKEQDTLQWRFTDHQVSLFKGIAIVWIWWVMYRYFVDIRAESLPFNKKLNVHAKEFVMGSSKQRYAIYKKNGSIFG